MENSSQKDSRSFRMLLSILALALMTGVIIFIVNATKPEKNETSSPDTANAFTPIEDITKYLTIDEWDVKIPLSDPTRFATYRIEGDSAFLDVLIEGTADDECLGQAAIVRVTNPDENSDNFRMRPSELVQIGSKVNGTYYYIEGSQAACSENTNIQAVATAVRNEWLKQGTYIVAE